MPSHYDKSATLLKKVDKELQSIPLYKGEKVYKTGGRDPYNFVEATQNAITGLRRGIRMLRGKESKPNLLAKKKRLENLMERAQNSIRGF
jgi:hypothetical protein